MRISKKIFYPPTNIAERDHGKLSMFLAGSIEMGSAIDWQTDICESFSRLKLNMFNPRRLDWNNNIKQEFTDPSFSQQVNWELNALDTADIIVIYFDPNTKSPISLLELGLYASSGKVHVICEEGFWRKGNVDIVCNRYNVPMYEDLNEFKGYIHHTYYNGKI